MGLCGCSSWWLQMCIFLKNFCASRLLRFSYGEIKLHRFSGILKKTDRKIFKNKKVKNIFFESKNFQNLKNRKIENRKSWISIGNFRKSKIENRKFCIEIQLFSIFPNADLHIFESDRSSDAIFSEMDQRISLNPEAFC